MFIKLGGTSKCNRYMSNINEKDTDSLSNNSSDDSNQLQQEQQLITSFNDMVAYIETSYTSKIMSIFLTDAKMLIQSMIDEINMKRELELQKNKLDQIAEAKVY